MDYTLNDQGMISGNEFGSSPCPVQPFGPQELKYCTKISAWADLNIMQYKYTYTLHI